MQLLEDRRRQKEWKEAEDSWAKLLGEEPGSQLGVAGFLDAPEGERGGGKQSR